MPIRIVTAAQGQGKTSFLMRYAARAADEGRSVGGVASPAVFDGDRHAGYDLLLLRTGRRVPLARAVLISEVETTVGNYRFDDEAILAGNSAVAEAVHDRLDIIAIDEVGPLEFRGQGWAPALNIALRECTAEQELILTVRPGLVERLIALLPSEARSSAQRVSPPWPI